MIRADIGQRGWTQGAAVATLTYTPLTDRAAIVRKFAVTVPSAADTWRVKVAGREVAAFRVDLATNQLLISALDGTYANYRDVFQYCEEALGQPLIYPVPQGQSITIASDGGATADVLIEYEEHDPADIVPSLLNHPEGSHFLVPLYLALASSVTAVTTGGNNFATQYTLSWLPTFTGQQNLPSAYRVQVLALWLQAAAVNAYASSTDHQSATSYLELVRNGMRMFTRAANSGIPLVGTASATGSANTVYTADQQAFPPFLNQGPDPSARRLSPLVINPGDQYQWLAGLSGDVGAGANFSHALQTMLLDVQLTGLAA